MKKLGLFVILMIFIVACKPTNAVPTVFGSTQTPLPVVSATTETDQWRILESLATAAHPIHKENPTNEWSQNVLAENLLFSSGLQIRISLASSTGANGILFTATRPGDTLSGQPFWEGHKRLELFYENGMINVLLRDGSMEEPVYSNQFQLEGNHNELLLVLDQHARNIEIRQVDRVLFAISPAEVGDFTGGLFPEGRILTVELSSAPQSKCDVTELTFLIPHSDFVKLPPTGTPNVQLPDFVIPNGLGVNVHFLVGQPWELDAIEEAGFGLARADAYWYEIEPSKGVYDFSATDIFVKSLTQRNIQAMFLLSSGNPLYDDGLAPHTEEGRLAFARFAGALAERYAGRGIIWDLWGEPNGEWSWKPGPNVQDYASFALEVISSIRQADPSAIIVGPGICCFEEPNSWYFYEELGRQGLFNQFDAVGIHSYNYPVLAPEQVPTLYDHLRKIVDTYSPERNIPIINNEYGYSTGWPGIDETRQAEYLARSWLINQANGVNLSLWYDWKDDGPDKNDPEDNFGLNDVNGRPKPAYMAAKTLMHTLKGYHFDRRISSSNDAAYLLLFSNGEESILVAWTSGTTHPISLPLTGDVSIVSMLGGESMLAGNPQGLTIMLNSSPQYIMLGRQKIQ